MKRVDWLRFLGVIVVCLLGLATMPLLEAAFTPWARSLSGGATLTGTWVGNYTTPTGARHALWLELSHAMSDDCANCPSIDGQIETCGRAGLNVNYEVWGGVENWSGTRFLLKTREAGDGESELRLGILNGIWEADELRLTMTLVAPGAATTTRWERNEAGEETTTRIDGHPDTLEPIEFSLAPGTKRDFEALCKTGAGP
jgi:hypothetical protein